MITQFPSKINQDGFNLIKNNISSPDKIKNNAEKYFFEDNTLIGHITNEISFDSQTGEPIIGGSFCQSIFGPINSWSCACKKYRSKKVANFTLFCKNCKVQLSSSNKRRYSVGYISLASPVINSLFLKNKYFQLLLDSLNIKISADHIKELINFYSLSSFEDIYNLSSETFVLSKDFKKFFKKFIHIKETKIFSKNFLEILQAELKFANYSEIITSIRNTVILNNNENELKKLRILESFKFTKTCPSWMLFTNFPIISPIGRPYHKITGLSNIVPDDKTIFYQALIKNNQTTHRILANDKINFGLRIEALKILQKNVDFIIKKKKLKHDIKTNDLNNKKLFNLTQRFESIKIRFKQTILGKRVDYSGRSVIISGPELKLNECGLPYSIANELFKPFLCESFKKIINSKKELNIELIHKKQKLLTWAVINSLCSKNYVMLNRSPTLHRYSIQTFNPVLTINLAISLHPLVCAGFNADFDGDQIAVHMAISKITQFELLSIMRPISNVLNSANNKLILKPSQEIIAGCYYSTISIKNFMHSLINCFSTISVAFDQLNKKKIKLHTPILLYFSFEKFLSVKKNKFLLSFFEITTLFSFTQNLVIYKFYSISHAKSKIYLLTNFGLLVIKKIKGNKYKILELFLEMTPGQLIFNNMLSNY